jgi:hypothetical protein
MANTGSTWILAALVMACAVASGHAAEFVPDDTGGTAIVVKEGAGPLTPLQLTQNVDPFTVVQGTSNACGSAGVTTDQGWWRLFDLDDGHGLAGDFCVESVDYAIQSAVGPTQSLTVNVYCLDDGLPFLLEFLTPVGTNSVPQPDATLEFFNIPVGGCCDADLQAMAVELRTEDCTETGTCVKLFIGMNGLGQYAPTYATAPDCGIDQPYDDQGWLWNHLIMVVNGEGEVPDDGGGVGGAVDAVQVAKLVPADGTTVVALGEAVAFDGDTAVIGAPSDSVDGNHSGSAYVFVRYGDAWIEHARLLPADGEAGNQFGKAVAVTGVTAVIGAPYDDHGAGFGSAYVFVRSGGVWTQQAKLLPADGPAGDLFGWSVALDGNTALIGAYEDDDNGSGSGSAYVFVRSGGVWSQQAKLLPADGDAGDFFGADVALHGDTALIGALTDDALGNKSGSAYVFMRSGGVWSEHTKLQAPDGGAGDVFGCAVALDGDTALIGARGDDCGHYDSGSAYVFVRSGELWWSQAKLCPSDGDHYDRFGTDVALSGGIAVIGAYQDDDNGFWAGSAYVSTRTDGVWTLQAKLLASDGAAQDLFGKGVALDGDTAVIGAPWDDDNGAQSGSAYVFRLVPADDVPATSVVGLVLLLLAVMGGGFYFMRRRTAG